MAFPTREQLIAQGRWPCETIQTDEVGPLRLARPSAAGGLRIRDAHQKGDQASLIAEMLLSACVDDAGKPRFATTAEAAAALESVSPETGMAVLEAVFRLTGTKGQPGGNSKASPGDGSPSASA